MLNGLDLFSGIGGMSIALQEWVRPIAYCEIDPYCQGVLLSRIFERTITNAPIWSDIKTLQSNFLPSIDIVYGGFPCQDISIAGHGKGLAGERSKLVFDAIRLVKELRPSFLFLENVPAITTRGGIELIKEIEQMGMDCRWLCISAESIGAPHRRERWFLLSHSLFTGRRTNIRTAHGNEAQNGSQNMQQSFGACTDVADSRFECGRFWETEPDVGRVADGIPLRSHRIKSLGNAVVPQQAKEAFKILMGIA